MIKIGLLGDVALCNLYDLSKNKNAKELFQEVSDYLNSLDLVIANLESPLTKKQNSLTCKAIHLKGDSSGVEILKSLNIGVVSLANNHIYDYGRKGAEDTINILSNNNIKHFGYSNKSISININNEVLNFHGFCCYSSNASGYGKRNGVIPLHKTDVDETLSNYRKGINVLSVHWGDENNHFPRYEFVKFARKLAEKYNFILHGHHPHVLQGIERINNSIINYSLGNFCFADLKSIFSNDIKVIQSEENKESLICEMSIENNKVIDTNYLPIRTLSNGKIVFLKDKEREIALQSVKEYSDALELNSDDYKKLRQGAFAKINQGNRYSLNWIIGRLNYYFIGAYIKGILNQRKYRKYFLN